MASCTARWSSGRSMVSWTSGFAVPPLSRAAQPGRSGKRSRAGSLGSASARQLCATTASASSASRSRSSAGSGWPAHQRARSLAGSSLSCWLSCKATWLTARSAWRSAWFRYCGLAPLATSTRMCPMGLRQCRKPNSGFSTGTLTRAWRASATPCKPPSACRSSSQWASTACKVNSGKKPRPKRPAQRCNRLGSLPKNCSPPRGMSLKVARWDCDSAAIQNCGSSSWAGRGASQSAGSRVPAGCRAAHWASSN
mmetsp:Transcript_26217/g.61875  ORF Transcript_26217/g.61875 Transcript_26217/m.61875 type:complete len:253 (-) Transcript_26217:4152-4910(-)